MRGDVKVLTQQTLPHATESRQLASLQRRTLITLCLIIKTLHAANWMTHTLTYSYYSLSPPGK
jgi:hypothetical protein